jgi:autotransporter adhesin
MQYFKRKVIITSIALLLSGTAFSQEIPDNHIVVDINQSTGSSIGFGLNITMFGQNSQCRGDNCVLVGNDSRVGNSDYHVFSSVLVGTQSSNIGEGGVVIGNSSSNTGRNGVAIGEGTVNTVDNNVSVGGRTIGDLVNASTDDQAVNLGQVKSFINGLTTGISRPEAQAIADTAQSNAVSQATVLANQAQTNAVAISNTYTDKQIQDKAITYDDSTKKTATLNKGGTAVQVKNVAYATESTDAANLQNVLDINKSYYNQTTSDIKGASAQTLQKANDYTDQKVGSLNHRMDSVESRLNGVGAMAMASSSLSPNPHIPNNNQIALAMGSYNGATAIAGAVFHYSQDKKVQYNVRFSAGTNGGGAAVGAGVAFGF